MCHRRPVAYQWRTKPPLLPVHEMRFGTRKTNLEFDRETVLSSRRRLKSSCRKKKATHTRLVSSTASALPSVPFLIVLSNKGPRLRTDAGSTDKDPHMKAVTTPLNSSLEKNEGDTSANLLDRDYGNSSPFREWQRKTRFCAKKCHRLSANCQHIPL